MFYRTRRILRTLLLLITGYSEGCSKSPVHFFRRNRKLAPKLDRLQRRVIFSRIAWNSKIVWEMGKSSRQRQYFNWSVHSFCFEINAQNKRTELICTPNILTYNNFYDFKISQHTNLLVIKVLFYNTRKGKDYYLYIK